MAATGPHVSPAKPLKSELSLPMPPPLLHTRSGNELYTGPQTPTRMGFTSPFSTPQGSPSKNKIPPGANELSNVFDDAMKITAGTPSKSGKPQLYVNSPNKVARQGLGEIYDDGIIHQDYGLSSGSPTKRSNKENTPPGIWQPKEAKYSTNQAAISRQEPYQLREATDPSARSRYTPQRGLTAEELEKLQLPRVKRLANVTQLCELIRYPLIPSKLM